jgi:hypothetical protein
LVALDLAGVDNIWYVFTIVSMDDFIEYAADLASDHAILHIGGLGYCVCVHDHFTTFGSSHCTESQLAIADLSISHAISLAL